MGQASDESLTTAAGRDRPVRGSDNTGGMSRPPFLLSLVAAVLAGSATVSAAADSRAPSTATPGPEPDTENVCVTGRLKWLLNASYGGRDICRDSTDMVAHIHKVAEIRTGGARYELYDYDYRFQAAVVRHGGARLLVVKNGKYAGQYLDAAGARWQVHGAVASLFWPKTKLATQVDFSRGPPHWLQEEDGGYTPFEP